MKTVIIGLDGATFDIITPLIAEGRLPALARLMREGASAPLRSTWLPNSFPAGRVALQGLAKVCRRLFAFHKKQLQLRRASDERKRHNDAPCLGLARRAGGRSIVVNVPTTSRLSR